MQYNNDMYRIYSRKRIRFNNNGFYSRGSFGKGKKWGTTKRKIKKMFPIIGVTLIAMISCYMIWSSVNPIFETICEEKAKAIATKVTNEETNKVMSKYNYDSFFTIEKDNNKNIKLITANVLKINEVTSSIASNIQKTLNESDKTIAPISMGALTGIRILSGIGPKISIKLATAGNIETDLKSEFIAQGVNQTIHRVYLEINCTINILTSFSTIEKNVKNKVLIAENVILGEIPSTYYNFEGINEKSTALEVVE